MNNQDGLLWQQDDDRLVGAIGKAVQIGQDMFNIADEKLTVTKVKNAAKMTKQNQLEVEEIVQSPVFEEYCSGFSACSYMNEQIIVTGGLK